MPTSSSCAKAAHPKHPDTQTASLKRLNPQATTDRPTLILLHGFRGAPQGLAASADDLRAAGYTVQAPPVPPFAGAPALKSYTPDTYADYFAHYLKTQPFSRPVINGHSMGSIVAAALAARYPDLIHSKLILLSPVSCRPAAGFAYLSKLPAFLPRRLVDFVTTSYLHIPSSQASFRDLLQLTHACSHDHSPRAADLLAASSFSAHHSVAEFTLPQSICIIAGEHDRLIPRAATEKLAKELHAELQLLPHAGHLHNYEFPHLTAAAIRAFLER